MRNPGEETKDDWRVSIFDPTGNITALVETPVAPERQSAAAAFIMTRFPNVEQVGFVKLDSDSPESVELRMAGGEFCGNASASAAALSLLRNGGCAADPDGWGTVSLRVSGVSGEVPVRLKRETEDVFRTAVRMPPVLTFTEEEFSYGEREGTLPVVRAEGISHAIVTEDSVFFDLLKDKSAAEDAVRKQCAELEADCLGWMFLEGKAPSLRLTPLVYVPGSGTMFWESSCASGSAAVGAALAEKSGAPIRLELSEPCGVLTVESEGLRGETNLLGRTRFIRTEILQEPKE